MMVLPFNPLNIMLIRACQWGPPPTLPTLFVRGSGKAGERRRDGQRRRLRDGLPDICFDWRCPLEKGGRVAGTSLYVIRLCVCVIDKKKNEKKNQGECPFLCLQPSFRASSPKLSIYLFIQLNEFIHLFPLGLAELPVCFKHLAAVFKKKKKDVGWVGGECWGGYLKAIVMKIPAVPQETRA